MDKYINSITSVIRAERLDPLDSGKIIKSLGECVCSTRLIKFYKENKTRISEDRYTYET